MGYAILNECTEFEWDIGNAQKSQRKHKVSSQECEELFFNVPLVVMEDEKHSMREARYYALGHTDDERLLFVVFTIRRKRIRVISARPMSKKERAIYET